MKKTILAFIIAIAMVFGLAYVSQAQTTLQWELEEQSFADGTDTIKLVLWYFLPMPDVKNVTSRYVLIQKKNGVEQWRMKLDDTKNLDTLMTIGASTKTHFEWLQMFLTVQVAYMEEYGRQVFYQHIDPDTLYIKPD